MSQRQLTVVIVHWNQASVCAETVKRFHTDRNVRRVIVVDNGSTDDQLATLKAALPEVNVDLIEVGSNSGFGPGVNRGWERWLADLHGTEWVAVAPHDADPIEGTLDKLVDAAHAGRAYDGRRYGLLSADVGDGAAPFVDHVFGPITCPATSIDEIELVDYPHGTLMLASRTCLEKVGLFDERFFAYCEEADLGLRAQAGGFAVGLVRGARVVNPHVNTPSALVDYLQERNTVLLVAKHFGVAKAALRFGVMVWQLVRGIVQASSRGPYWNKRARRLAIIAVLKRTWGPPPGELVNR